MGIAGRSRLVFALVLAFAVLSIPLFALDPKQVSGTWSMMSTTPGGDPFPWTLTLREENGALAGSASSSEGEGPLREVKTQGEELTCEVMVGDTTYKLVLQFSRDSVQGTWSGNGDQGPVKGSRK